MSDNPLDFLIDQIDDDAIATNSCIVCNSQPDHLYEMSCSHAICLDCMCSLIDDHNHKTCPSCHTVLTKSMRVLISDYAGSLKMNTLSQQYGMNINDTLWAYSGNKSNWLYNKENCDQINDALDEYLAAQNNDHLNSDSSEKSEESNEDLSKTEIQINTGSNTQTYVIDFTNQIQYPKNDASKCRTVFCFVLTSAKDLKKCNIVGVAGKLL